MLDRKKIGAIKTTNIKGKEYAEVNSRVLAFYEACPGGAIATELLHDDGDRCVFKATIVDEDGKVIATGHAYELQSASYINKTSYIENCETSAVGRALGFAGIGINGSICSAEELDGALRAQKAVEQKEQRLKEDRDRLVKSMEKTAKALGVPLADYQRDIKARADFDWNDCEALEYIIEQVEAAV